MISQEQFYALSLEEKRTYFLTIFEQLKKNTLSSETLSLIDEIQKISNNFNDNKGFDTTYVLISELINQSKDISLDKQRNLLTKIHTLMKEQSVKDAQEADELLLTL